jgi:hypothetical protein
MSGQNTARILLKALESTTTLPISFPISPTPIANNPTNHETLLKAFKLH